MGLLTGSRLGLPAGAHTTSSSLPGPPSLSRAQGQLTAALKPQLPGRAPMGGPTSRQEKQTPCYQERPPLALSSPRQLCPEPEGRPGGQPGLSWTFCVAEGISRGSGCGAPGQPFPSLGFGLSIQKQESPRAIGTAPRRGRPHLGVQRQGLWSALGPGREEAEGSVPTLQMGTLPSKERGRGLEALVSQRSPLGESLTP